MPALHTTGLLDRITAHSLDEDYAHVSERKRREAVGGTPPAGDRRAARGLTLAAAAAFGVLLATAAVQTARTEPVRQESQASLRAQAQERRQELVAARREIATLRRTVARVQGDALAASEEGRGLRSQLTALGVGAGTETATGPGLRIIVDDSPDADAPPGTEGGGDAGKVLDTDLQRLVNGLWVSGAEAVAINGQRLTALSSVRVAGGAITVNLRSLSRPYVVTAIGDPEQLAARFVESAGGSWWLNLESVYRLRFDMTTEDSLTVPAAPTVELRHARTPRGAR